MVNPFFFFFVNIRFKSLVNWHVRYLAGNTSSSTYVTLNCDISQ